MSCNAVRVHAGYRDADARKAAMRLCVEASFYPWLMRHCTIAGCAHVAQRDSSLALLLLA